MEILAIVPFVVFYFFAKALIFGTDDKLTKEAKNYADGIVMVKQRNYKLAIDWFSIAIIENPKSGLLFTYRGQCYLEMGKLYEALSDLTTACNLESIPEAYLYKGKALYLLDDYSNAFIELDKAVWHLRNNGEAYRYRGLTFLSLGKPAQADSDFKMAVGFGDEDANFLLRQRKTFS